MVALRVFELHRIVAVMAVLALGAGARADRPRATMADQLLAWELDAHDVLARLGELRIRLPELAPDLSALTTQPVADHESSGFGWRDDPFRHTRRYHAGTDFRAPRGTPVLAAGAGKVVYAGRMSGYGNVIFVDHGDGIITRYAHLRRIETHRSALVSAGDRIGQVGSTGRATGPHLHFEIRVAGHAVDPVAGMAVAALERDVPMLGRLASFSLAPALQAATQSTMDPPRPHRVQHAHRDRHHTRPERKGREPRPQILW